MNINELEGAYYHFKTFGKFFDWFTERRTEDFYVRKWIKRCGCEACDAGDYEYTPANELFSSENPITPNILFEYFNENKIFFSGKVLNEQ